MKGINITGRVRTRRRVMRDLHMFTKGIHYWHYMEIVVHCSGGTFKLAGENSPENNKYQNMELILIKRTKRKTRRHVGETILFYRLQLGYN